MNDFYKILGVEKTANDQEIKQAYRRLAAKYHPDRGGDTAKFQEIQQAYDVLGDEQKRRQYDNQGSAQHFEFGFNPFNQEFSSGFPPGFEDFFAQFGIHRGRRQNVYNAVLFVSLEQIASGSSENIQLNMPSGSKVCAIEIPRGIEDGQQIRYENIIPDASIIIQFRIKPHTKFNRRNLDLYLNENINVFDLILGTKIIVQDILQNNLEVNIAPRTKSGSMIRLSGRGLSNGRQNGDLYIVVQADIPENIGPDTINAIENEQRRKKS